MALIVVDSNRCVGCKRCLRACASGAIIMHERCAQITQDCIACGMCIDVCPTRAIERSQIADTPTDTSHDIWVYIESTPDATPLPVAYELLGRARELADTTHQNVVALYASATENPAIPQLLIASGADIVRVCHDPRFAGADAHVTTELITLLARQYNPNVLLLGATPFGRQVAPGVAAHLCTGLTADCTIIDMNTQTGLLQQTRPAFGGNLMATIECPVARPQMTTVRPGVFAAAVPNPSRIGTIENVSLPADIAPRIQILRSHPRTSATVTDANVLVVVGRGIGSNKNLAYAQQLADALGAKLACTRPLVEAGWLEYWHQVGQTGSSVAPKVLISLGVSGAIQHLAGIGGAQNIIAVNSNPDAPIFTVAHHALVGDCIEVTKALLDVCKSHS